MRAEYLETHNTCRSKMATEQSTDLAQDLAEAGTLAKKRPTLPLPLRGFKHWQSWAVIAIVLSGILGGLSYHSILRQPGPPKCDRVFWPFASASLRLYCAQEKANKPTLENLFAAIGLVDALGRNHPLRTAVNPLIERWSTQALDLAEEAFHNGDLERAIQFAQKIPAQTTAHALVEERIGRWRKIWSQGQAIYDQAEAALDQENWRKAFSIMVRLLQVDNRYWSKTQYEALNQKIIGAQQDEIKLAEIRQLRRVGNLESLTKALGLAQELGPESVFRKSAQSEIIKISRTLMEIAEDALEDRNLNLALEALQIVPRNVALWPEAQDMTEIAYAMSSAWDGSVASLEDAIAQISKVGPDRPLYARAKSLAEQWLAQMGHARLLQQAQSTAQEGSIPALANAINQAEQISADSPFWDEAQGDIADWRRQQQILEDTPTLDQADQLSLRGDRAALVAAIQKAQQIQPGRALYNTAQSRIQDWQNQIQQIDSPYAFEPIPSSPENQDLPLEADPTQQLWQDAQALADQGTPEGLVAAIETASRIPRESSLHFQATRSMDNWGRQLLQIAQSYANSERDTAIAIAEQIPASSGAYESAQLQLQQWRRQP